MAAESNHVNMSASGLSLDFNFQSPIAINCIHLINVAQSEEIMKYEIENLDIEENQLVFKADLPYLFANCNDFRPYLKVFLNREG